eukprot:gene14732-16352_t
MSGKTQLQFVPTQVLLSSKHVKGQLLDESGAAEERQSMRISDEEMSVNPITLTPSPLMEGNNANTSWRAIPWSHLRLHPLFRPLPPSEEVEVLSARDLTLFRQDSWQWDALHEGRLTTSKLASICGFYERPTAEFLGIPRSLQGHERVLEAWHHLKHKPPTSYSHLQQHRQHHAQKSQAELMKQQEGSYWKESDVRRSSDVTAFPYHYNPQHTTPPNSRSKHQITDAFIARLAWGSAQESTALLALLNYLNASEPSSQLCESGMAVFEALFDSDGTYLLPSDERKTKVVEDRVGFYEDIQRKVTRDRRIPLLGASPDGLIRCRDGDALMVVEVKCFSPFTSSRSASSGKAMTISSYRPDNRPPHRGGEAGGVPVWHVPQIQFEMFCAGVLCESARMVVLYFDGAKIYTIQRDDEYISLLLRLVEDFYSRYIRNVPSNRLKPPEPNFYQLKGGAVTGGAGVTGKMYRNFLLHTQRIAQSARLVRELTADEVQRSPDNAQFFLD